MSFNRINSISSSNTQFPESTIPLVTSDSLRDRIASAADQAGVTQQQIDKLIENISPSIYRHMLVIPLSENPLPMIPLPTSTQTATPSCVKKIEDPVEIIRISSIKDPIEMFEMAKNNREVLNHVRSELKKSTLLTLSLLKDDLSFFTYVEPWIEVNLELAKELLKIIHKEMDKIDLPKSKVEDIDLWKQAKEKLVQLFEIRSKIIKANPECKTSCDEKNLKKAVNASSQHDDYASLYKLIKINKNFFKFIKPKFSEEFEFVARAVEENYKTLPEVCDKLRKNKEFAKKVFEKFKEKLIDALNKTNLSEDEFIDIVERGHKFIEFTYDTALDTDSRNAFFRDIMQHKNVRSQKEWIKKILEEISPRFASYISESLFNDMVFLIDCCINCCQFNMKSYTHLDFIPKEFWFNPEFINSLVTKARTKSTQIIYQILLSKMDESLKNEDFLLALIEIDYNIVSYLPGKFIDDKNFMRLAMQKQPRASKFLSKKLLEDEDIQSELLKLLKTDSDILTNLYNSSDLIKNKSFIRRAIKENSIGACKFIRGEKLVNDNDIRSDLLEVLKTNCDILKEFSYTLCKDKYFMIPAIRINPRAAKYLYYSLVYDKEIEEVIKESLANKAKLDGQQIQQNFEEAEKNFSDESYEVGSSDED